jgi:hypothetical protein
MDILDSALKLLPGTPLFGRFEIYRAFLKEGLTVFEGVFD